MNTTLNDAMLLAGELTAIRRHLHRYPELSRKETETAALVARELTKLGLAVRTGVGGHGVVADLKGGFPGKTIALRADMDALPIQEETGLEFASARPGVMHACGHDAHTAMLLGAAKLLVNMADRLHGTVRFVFQPAEEVNAGAKAMIADGVLDGVAEIYGLHNLPTLSAGKAAVCAGPMMGSVDRLEIRLEGRGGHGAIPDQCVDPIVCASHVVMALQTIASRELSPFEPAVVTIGSLQAGDANNVIPHRAEMTGTIRTFDPRLKARMPERIERLVTQIAQGYRCKAEIRIIDQTPVLVNHAANARLVGETVDGTIGAENRVPAAPTMAGEDFSVYLEHVPGCFFWLGSGPAVNAEEAYGLHHPKYVLNEDCLPYGAALLANIACKALG
ncbi:amidohydrolase [Thermobacillus composti KWC4]|jgi:hippurate hydrolase|uniref:Amidohydrolase n=1 Tax=Thermobacillus composti (strain DSM 18247 / JCM 13945 / KWC4) TaxID=717605 RepID=L0ECR3_THECK|nr:M20 family metallopeptidase [Thermobacillus composti]AGA57404.1 amidohydrolase [Thermobacillus composti KWC4]